MNQPKFNIGQKVFFTIHGNTYLGTIIEDVTEKGKWSDTTYNVSYSGGRIVVREHSLYLKEDDILIDSKKETHDVFFFNGTRVWLGVIHDEIINSDGDVKEYSIYYNNGDHIVVDKQYVYNSKEELRKVLVDSLITSQNDGFNKELYESCLRDAAQMVRITSVFANWRADDAGWGQAVVLIANKIYDDRSARIQYIAHLSSIDALAAMYK